MRNFTLGWMAGIFAAILVNAIMYTYYLKPYCAEQMEKVTFVMEFVDEHGRIVMPSDIAYTGPGTFRVKNVR